MGRAAEVLDRILDEAQKSGRRAHMQDVYGDEPLIRTGREAFGAQTRRRNPSFPDDQVADANRCPGSRRPSQSDGCSSESSNHARRSGHGVGSWRYDEDGYIPKARRSHQPFQQTLYDDELIPSRSCPALSRHSEGGAYDGATCHSARHDADHIGQYDHLYANRYASGTADMYQYRHAGGAAGSPAGGGVGGHDGAGAGHFSDRQGRSRSDSDDGRQSSAPAADPLPEKIVKMRALQTAGWPSAYAGKLKTFYDQARFMVDYTDDQVYDGPFVSYYPTYEDLPDRVLRGYFTWRTRWRAGERLEAPLSFLFLYVYEILCGVGIEPSERGFRELARIKEVYGGQPGNRALSGYLSTWMRDYVVYYGLGVGLLEGAQGSSNLAHAVDLMRKVQDVLAVKPAAEQQIMALFVKGCHVRGGAMPGATVRSFSRGGVSLDGSDVNLAWRLFDAMADGSSYNVRHSKAYAVRPEVFAEVACGVFCELATYCRKHRKTTFVDGLFGAPMQRWYYMFNSAVFYTEHAHPDTRVELPSGETFVCRDGRWTRESPMGKIAPSKDLGSIMHAIDAAMRDQLDIQPLLKPRFIPKYTQAIVDEQVQRAVNRMKAEQAARVTIDRTKLSDIRYAATRTEEALLVDEERDFEEDACNQVDVPTSGQMSGQPDSQTHGQPSGQTYGQACSHASGKVNGKACDQVCDKAEAPQGTVTSVASSAPALFVAKPTTIATKTELDEASSVGLNEQQQQLVRGLLDGTFDRGAFEKTGAMTALVADQINEKLFDLIGDAVIAFDGDEPYLIEDYEPDVRELLA